MLATSLRLLAYPCWNSCKLGCWQLGASSWKPISKRIINVERCRETRILRRHRSVKLTQKVVLHFSQARQSKSLGGKTAGQVLVVRRAPAHIAPAAFNKRLLTARDGRTSAGIDQSDILNETGVPWIADKNAGVIHPTFDHRPGEIYRDIGGANGDTGEGLELSRRDDDLARL